jgi:hypothetical protein
MGLRDHGANPTSGAFAFANAMSLPPNRWKRSPDEPLDCGVNPTSGAFAFVNVYVRIAAQLV